MGTAARLDVRADCGGIVPCKIAQQRTNHHSTMRSAILAAVLWFLVFSTTGSAFQLRSSSSSSVPKVENGREWLAKQPVPRSHTQAKALHSRALQLARRNERAHGHVRMAAPAMPQSQPAPNADAPVIYPTSFGADPTGKTDSTAAFAKVMAALLTPRTQEKMASGIADLGGATLDLAGGEYLISEPLVIPPFFGNVRIVRGTLRAGASFPASSWLVEIGSESCHPDQQGSCNEFVEVSDVLLDASHQAAGGVHVSNVMGTTLGPSIFITAFNVSGIQIDHGHEVMVSEAWLAEYFWSQHRPTDSSSVGIVINGNDHYLNNVIVFDFTKVGVEVNGAANILFGVHTWNGGGTGISVSARSNRLIGCYLDYNFLVLNDPKWIVVENTFFLETNAILNPVKSTTIDGVIFRLNTYNLRENARSISLNGTFTAATGFIVQDEVNGNVATSAIKRQVADNCGKEWTFDFSDQLLLPWIDSVMISLETPGTPVDIASRPAQGRKVVVHAAQNLGSCNATVTIHVQQGL
eukprot:m.93927 g.93927  ORF g.93927 m.93927 type:complete len:523 (-) comp8702_c0_seq1:209-1777(-)